MVPRPSGFAALARLLPGELIVPRPSGLAVLPQFLPGELTVPGPSGWAALPRLLPGELRVPRPSGLALNFAERLIAHPPQGSSRTSHQSAMRGPIRPQASSQSSQHQSFCRRLAFHDDCLVCKCTARVSHCPVLVHFSQA
jgi:hypothetical protein